MRWLKPAPVWLASAARLRPPLGVTDTAQPFSSVASTLVVPSRNVRSYSTSAVGLHSALLVGDAAGILLCHFCRTAVKGFLPPWYGYGSPGRISGSLWSDWISFKRSRA